MGPVVDPLRVPEPSDHARPSKPAVLPGDGWRVNPWLEGEYQLRRVLERLPVRVRVPIRRFLTDCYLGRDAPPGWPRGEAAPPSHSLFSPPPPDGSGAPDARPVRILVEIPVLDRGGAEEFVVSLLERLDRTRFSPLVVCTEAGGLAADRCRSAGIPVAVLRSDRRRAYARLLDDSGIGVVMTVNGDMGPPLAVQRGIPVVDVLRNTCVWLSRSDRERLRRRDPRIARYVAASRAVQAYVQGVLGLPGPKITCVPNGIDVARHARLLGVPPALERRDLGLTAHDFVFLHVAAVDARKGHNVILAALAELVREQRDIKVLSVGPVLDRLYAQRMRRRVRRAGLEGHFRFVDFTPHLQDLYRLADAFLLPSLTEGFSLALLEAAFYGLPIIASRVGGAPELLEGESFGLVVDPPYDDLGSLGHAALMRYALEDRPRHTDQLVQAMREFLVRRDDWKVRGRLGRANVVASYDIADTARRYEAILGSVLGQRI